MRKLLINSISFGIKLTTSWRSPKEKPRKFDNTIASAELIIKKDNLIYIGRSYQYVGHMKWYLFFCITNGIKISKYINQIDGWQYLPSIE